MESRAKTDKTIKELMAELTDREEVSEKADEVLKKYHEDEVKSASEKNRKI